MNFRTWLESDQQLTQQKLEQMFRSAMQELVGHNPNLSLPLSKIESGNKDGGSPKGPMAAKNALSSIFQNLQQMGFGSQVNDTINWLQRISQKSPEGHQVNSTVGHLLNKLFGSEIYQSVTGDTPPTTDINEPVPDAGQDAVKSPEQENPHPQSPPTPFQPPNQQQISQEPIGQGINANSAGLRT